MNGIVVFYVGEKFFWGEVVRRVLAITLFQLSHWFLLKQSNSYVLGCFFSFIGFSCGGRISFNEESEVLGLKLKEDIFRSMIKEISFIFSSGKVDKKVETGEKSCVWIILRGDDGLHKENEVFQRIDGCISGLWRENYALTSPV